jgi:hypothetical protein
MYNSMESTTQRGTRGMQMLVIYGALAMTAYAAGGYWLMRWLSQ